MSVRAFRKNLIVSFTLTIVTLTLVTMALLPVITLANDSHAPDKPVDANLAAEDLIANLHENLLAVMQADVDFDQRYQQIEPVIASVFDLSLITRISIGRAWQTVEVEQRDVLVQLMKKLIASTYAGRFESFNDQIFEITEVKSSARGPIVSARIILRDDEPVKLDYHLKKNKIYNVVANGVSDLSLRRADYGSIINRSGIDGLITKIEKNIDLYRNADS